MIPILKIKDADGNIREITAIKGTNGKSAYDIAVANGFKGTEQTWLASLQAEPINEEDKAEVIEAVLNALPTWSGGDF